MKNDQADRLQSPRRAFTLMEPSAVSERQRRAFTLIELLAVIGVIAILAAILLPVLTSAIDKGNKARCFSNLRQWGAGVVLFLSDHDGLFPSNGLNDQLVSDAHKSDAWFNAIPRSLGVETLSNLAVAGREPGPTPPFNKTIFTCPALRGRGGGTNTVFSYAYNQWIDNTNRTSAAFGSVLRFSQIRTPAKFVVFGEGEPERPTPDVMDSTNLVYRHNGEKAANICFADGHVSSVEASGLTNILWNPEW